jgi:hypothetical protein
VLAVRSSTTRAFGMEEELRYLGTTFINQNSIQEEIKNTLKSFFHFAIQKYKD